MPTAAGAELDAGPLPARQNYSSFSVEHLQSPLLVIQVEIEINVLTKQNLFCVREYDKK